jgi:hypothetical protein
MSGCNCKSDKKIDNYLVNTETPNKKMGATIGKYILKTLAFILMLLALPIINLFIIWFIFKMLILNKDIDIKPLLYSIGNKFKVSDEDDDDNEYDELTEEDVVMVDVENIISKNKI